MDSYATGRLLIIYSAFVKYWRKNRNTINSASALYRLKKAYDSVRREVLYNILIEFGIPKKFVRLVKCVRLKRIAESG